MVAAGEYGTNSSVTFDRRGTGRSASPPGEWTVADFARDLRGLMDALDIERAIVGGSSLGGIIAAQFALDYPERVHAIIVPKQGATLSADEVMEHCRSQIAGYKCPRSVDFRGSALPLSGAGKVLKRDLREPYWKGFTKEVN